MPAHILLCALLDVIMVSCVLQRAAERLVKYWDFRKAVFGDKAFLPITLKGGILSEKDMENLKLGHISLLPPDQYGRTVMYECRGHLDDAGIDHASLVRYLTVCRVVLMWSDSILILLSSLLCSPSRSCASNCTCFTSRSNRRRLKRKELSFLPTIAEVFPVTFLANEKSSYGQPSQIVFPSKSRPFTAVIQSPLWKSFYQSSSESLDAIYDYVMLSMTMGPKVESCIL